jgi:hypothetical protein
MVELCRLIRPLGSGIVWKALMRGHASYTRSKHLVDRVPCVLLETSFDYGRGAGVGRERGVGRGLDGVGRIPL